MEINHIFRSEFYMMFIFHLIIQAADNICYRADINWQPFTFVLWNRDETQHTHATHQTIKKLMIHKKDWKHINDVCAAGKIKNVSGSSSMVGWFQCERAELHWGESVCDWKRTPGGCWWMNLRGDDRGLLVLHVDIMVIFMKLWLSGQR